MLAQCTKTTITRLVGNKKYCIWINAWTCDTFSNDFSVGIQPLPLWRNHRESTHCVHHYPSINCLFSVFSNINGEQESTLTTSKKYSWCIPVQKEINPIIWGVAITPEPWNRQQCLFIFEDPNVRVVRLLESLTTMTTASFGSAQSDVGLVIKSPPKAYRGRRPTFHVLYCKMYCRWSRLS